MSRGRPVVAGGSVSDDSAEVESPELVGNCPSNCESKDWSVATYRGPPVSSPPRFRLFGVCRSVVEG